MSIRHYAAKEVGRFPFLDNTNKVIEQLFAVFTFPVVIPLVHWYDESLSGPFKEFQ
jgi:hypothetical protein